MNILKKLFCKHQYELIAKRHSSYCWDWATFSDLGMYDDFLYRCSKCGKEKVKTFANDTHPEYHPWEPIKDKK